MPQDPRLIDKEAREAWKLAPIGDLIRHLVEHYHLETRVEMARLESYAEEAALLDGRDHPVLLEIRGKIIRLATEMRAHLLLEEREAFPALLASMASEQPEAMAEPMKKILMEDHEAEAALLRRIRALTESYVPTPAAGPAHLKLQTALKALSENLQQHLFLENQILFQRLG